jgi:hypothetical protein
MLVPKLKLGNSVEEALASSFAKLELRFPGPSAGAFSVIHKYLEARLSGRDSRQATLPVALRVNANLFQTDLCRNPVCKDVFKLVIHGTG